jgi:hypothetical protein
MHNVDTARKPPVGAEANPFSVGGPDRRIAYYALRIFGQTRCPLPGTAPSKFRDSGPSASRNGQKYAVNGPRHTPEERVNIIAFQNDAQIGAVRGGSCYRFRLSFFSQDECQPATVRRPRRMCGPRNQRHDSPAQCRYEAKFRLEARWQRGAQKRFSHCPERIAGLPFGKHHL